MVNNANVVQLVVPLCGSQREGNMVVYANVVQLVERLVANEKVAGSSPVVRSTVIENERSEV